MCPRAFTGMQSHHLVAVFSSLSSAVRVFASALHAEARGLFLQCELTVHGKNFCPLELLNATQLI